MKEPKIVKITYVAEIVVLDPAILRSAHDELYSLFDEVLYNSAEAVTGVQMLVGRTELRMEGDNN